nr:MAG TPA: hypothetical protein [Caudoviricetes sp.]
MNFKNIIISILALLTIISSLAHLNLFFKIIFCSFAAYVFYLSVKELCNLWQTKQ